MTRIRLLPVLVFGLVSLVAIKLMGLALAPSAPSTRQETSLADRVARSVHIAREGTSDDNIVTGSVPKKEEGEKKDEKKPAPLTPEEKAALEKAKAEFKLKAESEGVRIPLDSQLRPNRPSSPEERALLEKLKDRRDEIETRDRELEMRDNLLRMSERKLDERIGELRSLENQAGAAKDKSDVKTRYKPLVVMYENMKPKEAARVFDRLDVKVLLDLVDHMNARKMSEILAAMEPAAAERLTVAMARKAAAGDAQVAEAAKAGEEVELPRLPAPGRR
jgi:flagellar motility protein MotE (MotC chaperone)